MRFLIVCSLVFIAVSCNKKPQNSPDFEVMAGIKEAAPVVAEAPKVEEAPAESVPVAVAEVEAPKAELVESTADAATLERGKRAYMAVCIQCHNKDPNKKGAIGPELIDAPIEVMNHKVATGVYPDVLPEGFVPKRKTKAMRKLPNSVKDVPDIYAWIQSVKAN